MQSVNDKNRINNVIENAIKNLNGLVDVDTVMGSPIKGDNGEIILPFSKVTFGLLVGGGEYGKVSIFKNSSDLPYSAGNGAVVSIKPSGFLIKENNSDNFKVVSVSETSYEKFIEKATDFIKNLEN
ncbi:MAG: hypothetical protein IKB98_03960 [Clostridia bacterium]|jgi:sporulation protein YtfJ|nr:hypothetical protein [Clostridia bacterium]